MSLPQNSRVDRPFMPADYGLKPVNSPADLLTWEWVEERLLAARNYWLCTTRPNGRPHVTPVWGLWYEGAFYFGASPGARKTRNLAANPEAVVHLESGDEVVIVEGVVETAVDAALLANLGDLYLEKYNVQVIEDPQNSSLNRLRPQKALAWFESDFPWTATRFRF